MGFTGKLSLALFFSALPSLHSQKLLSAPANTTPSRQSPSQESSYTDGLLTPEAILPEGFTLRSDGFKLNRKDDQTELAANGNIRMLTNQGDTLTASRALALIDPEEGSASSVTFHDKVQLRSSNGIEIHANQATIDESDQSITFRGSVSTFQGSARHRGDSVKYYYETRKLSTNNLRTSLAPIIMESGRFEVVEGKEGNIYQGTNAGISTHDAENPNFWLRGEKVTVVPGDKIKFKNLKLYAGDRPIFWLPSLTQSFDGEFNYRPTPGGRSNWGAFLLNEYSHDLGGIPDSLTGIRSTPTHRATWRGDIYTRRGFGLGLDLESYKYKDKPNLGSISLYHIYDFNPGIQRSAEPRFNFDDPNRFIVQVRQRAETNLLPGATGHVDLNSTLLSDTFFLEDFRPSVFITDFQPDNTLSLSQQWKDSQLLTAWTRFRINDFYQSDQRLPEIAFDQVRRPIFGSAILHESQNTIGLYREDLGSVQEDALRAEFINNETTEDRRDAIENLLAGNGFARFHTYHELSLPFSPSRGLTITPRAGLGYTRYEGIEGPLDSEQRTHLQASVDASLKFTKKYPDWVSKKWGLDSALHVFQPYINASVLQTNDLDATFRPIERLSGTTRPRALNLGRFAAIDEITDWQILRLGAQNRILTKRNGSSHQWLSVNTFIDVFGEDPEFNRSVSNLYTDVHWSPLPWLDVTAETQVPLFSDSNFTELSTGVQFMPNENTEIGLRHRFLENHPILLDSNRLELRIYHRFNEEWGVGTSHRWEFADNTLEFQQYSLYRNLDSWALNLGIFTRDNNGENEFGALLGFTLTAFPSVSLPLQVDN